MAEQYSAEEFLFGGGVASAKFPTIGTSVSGRIHEKPTVSQQSDFKTGEPKVWADGKPQLQLVVTLATSQRDPEIEDDDGLRRVYVKGQMKKAVSDAVRRTGAKGLEVGGTLTVTYASDGAVTVANMSPPKQYTAQYVAAADGELHRPDPGQPAAPQYAQPAAPAPVQYQQPIAPVAAQYAPPAAPVQYAQPAASAPVQYQQPAPPVQYAQPVPPAVPGLTAEQLAAAQADPATAALLAQLLAQQAQQAPQPVAAAPAPQPGVDAPPF